MLVPLSTDSKDAEVAGNPNHFHRSLSKWFNMALYTENLPGQYGNAGRDSLLAQLCFLTAAIICARSRSYLCEQEVYMEAR
jgi:hypothetical protein